MAEAYALDDSVRRSDLDLWLSSRFIADEAARADVVALYALARELARVREAAREPLIQEIRLAWWRDALDEMASGGAPPAHPVLQAVERAVRTLPKSAFEKLIEAAFERLDASHFGAVERFELAVMRLAAHVLKPDLEPIEDAAAPAARAWAVARAPSPDRGAVRQALEDARPRLRALPPVVFPAFAHVTLAPLYAAGRTPSGLGRRLRIVRAVLRGRI